MAEPKTRAPVERVALSVPEAAHSMSLSEGTLRELMRARPDFPVIRVSANRKIIPVQPLREWLAREVAATTTNRI